MNKKILSIILAILCVLSTTTTFAAVGDVTGYTTYTDIRAYINHYAIQSYNVNGYTVVVAEDLADFGFTVVWSQEERSLRITRNPEVTDITQKSIPMVTSPDLLGKPAFEILETDIKTYINGVEVPSYNINGKTVVDISSLGVFGSVNYDETYRVIKLWIQDGLEMNASEQEFTPLPKYRLYSPNGDTIDVYKYQINDYLNVGWYTTESEANAVKKAADDAKNAEKNRAIIGKFYVGQNVSEWVLLYTRYGVVQSIDYSTGKVLVYWNYAEDAKGKELDYLSGKLYASLYEETWVDAIDLNRLY